MLNCILLSFVLVAKEMIYSLIYINKNAHCLTVSTESRPFQSLADLIVMQRVARVCGAGCLHWQIAD
jgi:hypothetical protein